MAGEAYKATPCLLRSGDGGDDGERSLQGCALPAAQWGRWGLWVIPQASLALGNYPLPIFPRIPTITHNTHNPHSRRRELLRSSMIALTKPHYFFARSSKRMRVSFSLKPPSCEKRLPSASMKLVSSISSWHSSTINIFATTSSERLSARAT